MRVVDTAPTSARAWRVVADSDDPTTAVRLDEVSLPALRPDDVCVEVRAAAIGFPDLLLATGRYHDRPALPFTLGSEAAGHVVAAGADAAAAPGDAVIVVPGQVATGLLAERLVVPAERTLPVPHAMSWVEAAGFTSGYQTAYIALARRAHLTADEVLLVLGASGGVGSAAVEIGRSLGARVVAVTRGADKATFCAHLGADHVIDLADDGDLVTQVRELTGGVDVVLDPVGGDLTSQARRCLVVEGRLVVVGFASGDVPHVPVNHALIKNYSIIGFRTWPFRGDAAYRSHVHAELTQMHARGDLRPRVEPIPFTDVPRALAQLGDRRVAGRLVATMEA